MFEWQSCIRKCLTKLNDSPVIEHHQPVRCIFASEKNYCIASFVASSYLSSQHCNILLYSLSIFYVKSTPPLLYLRIFIPFLLPLWAEAHAPFPSQGKSHEAEVLWLSRWNCWTQFVYSCLRWVFRCLSDHASDQGRWRKQGGQGARTEARCWGSAK